MGLGELPDGEFVESEREIDEVRRGQPQEKAFESSNHSNSVFVY